MTTTAARRGARHAALALCATWLAGCALPLLAPPTGWIAKDSKTGQGTYLWANGERYDGQFRNDTFHGVGTYSWPERSMPAYEGNYPGQLMGARLTLQHMDGTASPNGAKLLTREFTYEGGYKGGTAGRGVLTLKDGRKLEGEFTHEPVLFDYYPAQGGVRFGTSTVIGSKISGQAVVTWPDGSVFEGKLLDFHVFSRSVVGKSCVAPSIYGYGKLSVPGQLEYVGPVGDSYPPVRPTRTHMEALERHAGDLAACSALLEAARSTQQGHERRQEAAREQGRREAQAWLSNEIAKMPGQMRRDMNAVQLASRGTTTDIEANKARQAAMIAQVTANAPRSAQSGSTAGSRAMATSNSNDSASSTRKATAAASAGRSLGASSALVLNGTSADRDAGATTMAAATGGVAAGTTDGKPLDKIHEAPKRSLFTRDWGVSGTGKDTAEACQQAKARATLSNFMPAGYKRTLSVGDCKCKDREDFINGASFAPRCDIPLKIEYEREADRPTHQGPGRNSSR